jgi:23S rRNA (uracil1939-C5)-methyltransferase
MNNPSTCKHYPACSGCTLTDIYMPPIWKEALSFFREYGIEAELLSAGFLETRFKAKLAVRTGPEIGLFKKNSHECLSIPHCLVHHRSINEAVSLIRQEMIAQKITPYQENTSVGSLRYLQLFVERQTGKIQLVLVTREDLSSFCKSLLKYDLWHSIWQNIQKESSNRILGDQWELMSGEPFVWQTINNISIPFHPGAFAQAHLPLFDQMVQKIASWVRPQDRVLELYAGVGAIGATLTCEHVTLVENNPYADLSFRQMKKTNMLYLNVDAKEAKFSGFDLTIVDPPRKGLEPEIISKIESQRLVYVSCGFDSFKRDCKALCTLGWRLKEAKGYLFFPGTNHVEVLAYYERLECNPKG